MAASPSGRSARPWLWGAVAVGAFLRLLALDEQVVAGDEVHVLRNLCGATLPEILGTYHRNDSSIPVTAWCWWLARTVGLEEWGLRLGSWLPGILLVGVVPRTLRRWLGPADRVLLAWILATSPVLVYWSRLARPYSAAALLGWLALVTYVRYARSPGATTLLPTAGCAFALFLASPPAAPFLVALGLAAAILGWGLPAVVRYGAARRTLVLFAPLLVCAGAVALTLGPALVGLAEIQASRDVSGNDVTSRTLLQALRLTYGLPQLPPQESVALPVSVPLILATLGLAAFARGRRALCAAAVLLVLPGAAFALTGFHLIGTGIVFLRYQAALVPLLLALTVRGWVSLRTRAARGHGGGERALVAAGFVVLAALVVTGPLRGAYPPASPFGLSYSRLFQTEAAAERFSLDNLPGAYRAPAGPLSGAGDADAPPLVVDWPGLPLEESSYGFYAAVHGAPIVRSYHPPPRVSPEVVRDAGLALRTFFWDFESLPGRVPPGTLVVLHRRPKDERAFLQRGREPRRPTGPLRALESARETCARLFGGPVFEDDWTVVYRVP